VKHKGHIPAGKRAASVVTPKKQMESQPQPAASLDAMMEAIHLRANYVGPVLEGILRRERSV
jgi:hypothetical protein